MVSAQAAIKRADGRKTDQLRSVFVTFNAFGYAAGSVLFELGNTKVLCGATLQNNVPLFLKKSKKGWLTAEYEMLPIATQTRTDRVSSACKKNNRAIEISRLIGRALRTIVSVDKIGERTITIDCDVLQADGSTRVAAICGAYLAVRSALSVWIQDGLLSGSMTDYLSDEIAAVSVGVMRGTVMLDIDYTEDMNIDADFNFILTRAGAIIELQGSSEKVPVSWDQFNVMRTMALKGTEELFHLFDQYKESYVQSMEEKKSAPLFSLMRRQKNNEIVHT